MTPADSTSVAPDLESAVRGILKARGHDLLVVGPEAASRAETSCPVLIVRGDVGPPESVLFADDADGSGEEAGRLAALIAGEFGSHAAIAAPPLLGRKGLAAMGSHAEQFLAATGREPLRLSVEGDPVHAVPALIREMGSSLLVLGSAWERVAHAAPCSVLVARG